ncbi:MAG: D-Methionine transporter, periplasmic D-methionine-binding protein [Pseudomonadota bacterium]|jgi:D-methionine transport system substrate-binding protein
MTLLSKKPLLLLTVLLILQGTGLLSGCQQSRGDHEIIVGTMAGPETELMRVAAEVAKENDDLIVKIMEFEDYIMPNTALSEGSIDANLFQHTLFLEKVLTSGNLRSKITAIGKGFIYPMGLYSKQWHHLSDIPEKAQIAIPVDPSNSGRALLLLAKGGLITLKPNTGNSPTLEDIVANPKQLRIEMLDAAAMPRLLNDVDCAAINTNYALPAGLSPSADALLIEDKDSPYANVLVVRMEEQLHPKYQQLLNALHSEAVLAKAKALFSDQAIAAW